MDFNRFVKFMMSSTKKSFQYISGNNMITCMVAHDIYNEVKNSSGYQFLIKADDKRYYKLTKHRGVWWLRTSINSKSGVACEA